jgi:hypothetical protein
MHRERKALLDGKDHMDMFPLFRSLLASAGVKKGDTVIWAGCEGYCYSMATFFSYAILDLGLRIYFASEADIDKLWRLELMPGRGVAATEKAPPLKANVLVLMSGLVSVPFENVLNLVKGFLADDGVIVGETVVPGLFESLGWHDKIPFRFLFEFSMVHPAVAEMV